MNYIDPDGRYVESAVDAASLGVGLVSLRQSINRGDIAGTVLDSFGIVVDAVALALPIVPGGAGLGVRALRGVDAGAHVTNRLRQGVQTGQRFARNVDIGVQVASTGLAAYQGDVIGASFGLVGLGFRQGQLADLDAVTEARLYSRFDAGISGTVSDGVVRARRASRNRTAAVLDDFAESHGVTVRPLPSSAAERLARNNEASRASELFVFSEKAATRTRAPLTLHGRLRVVDVLDEAALLATEVKVGRVFLDRNIRRQLARDIRLLRADELSGVEYQFFRSATTGLTGPSANLASTLLRLRDKLQSHGLNFNFSIRDNIEF